MIRESVTYIHENEVTWRHGRVYILIMSRRVYAYMDVCGRGVGLGIPN